jgi:hypothetical protein
MHPLSDVTLAPLLPAAGALAFDAFQNLSLHGTHASLDLATLVNGDYGGGSYSKPAPAPKKSKSKSKRDENSIWTRPTSRKRKNKMATQQPAVAQPWPCGRGVVL